ncbi:hypothetical protein ABC628_09805 [Lentilactobacillus otakiensis]|uniref:hypothetical protein n=1 Tax=Lentilactobacillus otakiensis TaxID=481720 RepID=UPI0031D87884
MAYDLAKVTANGNNLIAQILANKSSLSIDKIEISDTQLSSTTDISTMTSVPKVVQTVSANGFSKNSNTLIISTVVDNSSIRADYKAWVFGIWGSDSQNGQSQLIAVITSTNSPDTIPAFSGRTPVSYTYKFNIGFSNASQIQFNMIDDSFATNDTVVHTTGDETIDGQKKFKTDPTDGAGNAYAKTVDVNQQLDKKVNIADMRKPASDVAGIDEVNAKQDKIGYTPADDSKVVHDNHDNTITANGSIYDLSKSGLTPVQDVASGSFNDLPLGTVFADATKMTDGPDRVHGFTTTTFYSTTWGGRKAQIAIADSVNLMYFRMGIRVGFGTGIVPFNSWVLLSDDSKVVHSTDASNWQKQAMFNPGDYRIDTTSSTTDFATLLRTKYNKAGIVYIRENNGPSYALIINAVVICEGDSWWYAYGVTIDGSFAHRKITETDDTGWIINADDSKVAHLSGANNFDTVPTVNNNPLLLASSLPSDLARTGQAQTYTAAQTFSIAPTITDASQDKGDNQAATMADLKSVEKSAWRQLDNSHIIFYYAVAGTHHTDCLYKIDPVNKKIYIHWIIQFEDRSNDGAVYLDFSSVVSQFTSQGPGKIMCQEVDHRRDISSNYDFSISGSQISFNTSFDSSVYASGPLEDCWFGYDTLLI